MKGFLLYYNQHILARYLRRLMDSQEYSDISSVVFSDEISILSKGTDEEAEEIAAGFKNSVCNNSPRAEVTPTNFHMFYTNSLPSRPLTTRI